MSDYHKTVVNDTVNDVSCLLKDTFQELLIGIKRLEDKNKGLQNSIEELEELLKIAKERN